MTVINYFRYKLKASRVKKICQLNFSTYYKNKASINQYMFTVKCTINISGRQLPGIILPYRAGSLRKDSASVAL